MGAYGYATATHGTPAVTGTSGTVLAANPQRTYARFQNLGTVPVYLAFGTAAALANSGVVLAAAGDIRDTYEMTRGQANVFTGPIMGIVAAGTFTVAVTEGA